VATYNDCINSGASSTVHGGRAPENDRNSAAMRIAEPETKFVSFN
jgi:hypothetical protein